MRANFRAFTGFMQRRLPLPVESSYENGCEAGRVPYRLRSPRWNSAPERLKSASRAVRALLQTPDRFVSGNGEMGAAR